MALLFQGVALQVHAQSAKDQLVGTWMLVSNYTDREDGSKVDTFGPNPKGIVILDGDGRLFLQEMRSDLPKFASNNRLEGTAEENEAIVQGSICYFGTYSVDEAAKTLTFTALLPKLLYTKKAGKTLPFCFEASRRSLV